MSLNDALIESLLHQEEGTALDFKQKQYPFHTTSQTQTTEELRSELVKDLLAFANTQRDSSAYILIGVQEVKGGRSNVTGISQHLLDNELHDFMNKITQRAVEFSYSPYHFDGDTIGVIEIPVQEGLFFLKTYYGKLRESTVYIRDGSSTRIATPDEIAEMLAPKPPSFCLNWIDSISNEILRPPCTVHSLILNPVLEPKDIQPDGPPRKDYWASLTYRYNDNYPADLIIYTFYKNISKPLGLLIQNKGEVTGERIRFEGSIAKRDKLIVVDAQPELPEEYSELISPVAPHTFHSVNDVLVKLSEKNESWEILVEFGNVRPGEQVSTVNNLWFGSALSQNMTMNGKILGENIPNPIPQSLRIEFSAQEKPMTIEDVENAKAQE